MILKTLVTGAAAAAVVAAAAGGVTSIASSASPATPAIQPVVWAVPLPQAPAPDLQAPLVQTLNGLAAGGSFAGAKSSYIEGGIGRIEGIAADRAYNNAAAKGTVPAELRRRRHRPGGRRRNGQRHRDGQQRCEQLAACDVRRRPQPDRLADLEAIRPGAAELCRVIPAGARHPCRNPERRHDRGGARACRVQRRRRRPRPHRATRRLAPRPSPSRPRQPRCRRRMR